VQGDSKIILCLGLLDRISEGEFTLSIDRNKFLCDVLTKVIGILDSPFAHSYTLLTVNLAIKVYKRLKALGVESGIDRDFPNLIWEQRLQTCIEMDPKRLWTVAEFEQSSNSLISIKSALLNFSCLMPTESSLTPDTIELSINLPISIFDSIFVNWRIRMEAHHGSTLLLPKLGGLLQPKTSLGEENISIDNSKTPCICQFWIGGKIQPPERYYIGISGQNFFAFQPDPLLLGKGRLLFKNDIIILSVKAAFETSLELVTESINYESNRSSNSMIGLKGFEIIKGISYEPFVKIVFGKRAELDCFRADLATATKILLQDWSKNCLDYIKA
jgi:hypothetical protein